MGVGAEKETTEKGCEELHGEKRVFGLKLLMLLLDVFGPVGKVMRLMVVVLQLRFRFRMCR